MSKPAPSLKEITPTADNKTDNDVPSKVREHNIRLQNEKILLIAESTVLRREILEFAEKIPELTTRLSTLQVQNLSLTNLNTQYRAEFDKFRAFKDRLTRSLNEFNTPQPTPFKSRSAAATVDDTATAASAIAVNLNEQFSLDSKYDSDVAFEPNSPTGHSDPIAGMPNSPDPIDMKETFEDNIIKNIKEYHNYFNSAYTTIRVKDKELETCRSQIASLTEKAEQLRTLEEQFKVLQEDNERLNVNIARQEKKAIVTINHHLDAISSLEEDIVKLRKTQDKKTEALKKNLEQMDSTIKQKEHEIVVLKQELHQKEKALNYKDSEIRKLQQEEIAREEKLDAERRKSAAANAEITRKNQEASKKLRQLGSIEARIPQLKATMQSQEKTILDLTDQIHVLIQEKDKVIDVAEQSRLLSEQASFKKISRLEQDLAKLRAEYHKRLNELQSLHENALAAQQKQFAEEQIRMQALLTQRFTALQTRFELESCKSQQELLTMFRININRKHEADIASMRSVQDRLMQENAALRMSQASESKVNAELRARETAAIEELRNRNESLMRELQSQRESVDRKSAEELRKREAEALPLLAAPVRVQTPPLQESVPALPVPVAVPVEPPQQPIQQEHEAPGPALPPPPPLEPAVMIPADVQPVAVLPFQPPQHQVVLPPAPPVVFQQPVQAINQNAGAPVQYVPPTVINNHGRFEHRLG